MVKDTGPYLIWDRQQPHLYLAGRGIYLVPETHLPFQPDVIVMEQDTWLVLGAQSFLKEDARPAWVQANQLENAPEYNPGTVIPVSGTPHRILAIVYDLSQQPTCRVEWVRQAVQMVLHYCQEQGLSSLQLPLIGYRHGGLEPGQFADLLQTVLREFSEPDPVAIQISLPDLSLRQQLLEKLKQ